MWEEKTSNIGPNLQMSKATQVDAIRLVIDVFQNIIEHPSNCNMKEVDIPSLLKKLGVINGNTEHPAISFLLDNGFKMSTKDDTKLTFHTKSTVSKEEIQKLNGVVAMLEKRINEYQITLTNDTKDKVDNNKTDIELESETDIFDVNSIEEVKEHVQSKTNCALFCICSAKLFETTPLEAYGVDNQVYCDLCSGHCPSTEVIHHCIEKNVTHVNGYDMCHKCFQCAITECSDDNDDNDNDNDTKEIDQGDDSTDDDDDGEIDVEGLVAQLVDMGFGVNKKTLIKALLSADLDIQKAVRYLTGEN